MMNTHNDDVQPTIDGVIDLFAWAYDVAFRPDQRAAIRAAILQEQSNADASDAELMRTLIEVHNYLVQINQKLKAEVKSFFQSNFNLEEGNDRSQIPITIYQAIMELRSENPSASNVPQQGFASPDNAAFPQPAFSSSSNVPPENMNGSPAYIATLVQPTSPISRGSQSGDPNDAVSPEESLKRRQQLDREHLVIMENAYYWQNYMDKWKSIFGRM